MTTIADIQAKILAKMENKFKGGATKQRLQRMLSDVDSDKDGLCVRPGPSPPCTSSSLPFACAPPYLVASTC
jgi:hypothetical protein